MCATPGNANIVPLRRNILDTKMVMRLKVARPGGTFFALLESGLECRWAFNSCKSPSGREYGNDDRNIERTVGSSIRHEID